MALPVPIDEGPDELREVLAPLRNGVSVALMSLGNAFAAGAIVRVAHSFLVREIFMVGDAPHYEKASMGMEKYETIVRVPDGFAVTARTEDCPVAMFEATGRGLYGVQYHPEVAHTPRGQALLERFLYLAAGCTPTWTMDNFIEVTVQQIRDQVGAGRTICALSGGVDSAVAAALVHRAIGDQLTCIFVDHGLLREGEGAQVAALFRDHYNIPLIHADAAELFLSKLAGVTDPEAKRKIIGGLFVEVFEAEAATIGGISHPAARERVVKAVAGPPLPPR